MKSMRSVTARNAYALEYLFQTRPALRRAFHQFPHTTNPASSPANASSVRARISPSALATRPSTLRPRKTSSSISGLRSQTRCHSSSSSLRSTNPFNQAFRQRHGGQRRHYSSSSNSGAASEEKLTLSQRLKKLSREYGWSALGVYLLLTALDFPFCFLAVRQLGTDRIGRWEHAIVSYFKGLVKWPLSSKEAEEELKSANESLEKAEKVSIEEGASKRILEEESQSQSSSAEEDGVNDHGYKEAEKANSGANASLWTQLALAYAIHKSFIFVRVPLTAAITPKVVKTLRSWGWNIGKVPKKSSSASSSSVASNQSSKTGVNTQGSKVKPDN